MNEPDPLPHILDLLPSPASGADDTDDAEDADDPEGLVAQALRLVERSELGYPEAFRRVGVALLLSDGHGTVDEANAAMGRALGRPVDALETQDLARLLHPGDRGGLRSGLTTLSQLAVGGTTAIDVRLLPRRGEAIEARAHGTVLSSRRSRPKLLWEFRSPADRPLGGAEERVSTDAGEDAGEDAGADAGTDGGDAPDLLPPARALRVLILVRQSAVGEAIAEYLRPLECTDEVLHGTDPASALRAVQRDVADLVVMSVAVPGLDPVEFARRAKESSRRVRLVAIGVGQDDDLVLSLVEEGVDGFLFQGGSLSDLAAAVNGAARDELVLPPPVAARVAARLAKMTGILRSRAYDPDAYEALTPREREVLGHLARDRTNREIGRRLGITVGTVKTHVHHILTKLDLQGREQAADYLAVARPASGEQRRK